MSNLLSVIVPIYNIESYVGKCIESISCQDYNHLEIILVDDGSTDRSGEICDLYATKDSRIKVIHKQNGGLVSARKTGISAATGEYATYVDGDDWIEKDYYSNLMKHARHADVIVSGYNRVLFDKCVKMRNNISIGSYDKSKMDIVLDNMLSYKKCFKLGMTTYVWNKIFKKDLLEKYQMMVDDRITIGEDAAVVYPLLLESKEVIVTKESGYNYRQRADSMLKRKKPFSEEKKGLIYLYDYLKEKLGNKYSDQLEMFILAQCIMRSGGLLDREIFSKPIKDKKLVVYSAGTFGQQLINRIKENNYAKIVGWIDEDYWEYRRGCMDVDSIDSIKDKEYDYIVIAALDEKLTQSIEKILCKYGVHEDKILKIVLKKENKKELIEGILETNG